MSQAAPEPAGSTTNVNIIVQQSNRGHGCLVTVLWFLCVGWWASFLWITVAWLCMIGIITMPIGLAMLNRVPKIATLREPSREFTAVTSGAVTRIEETRIKQRPFWIRAIYFFPVGLIVSLFWSYAAWFLMCTLVGWPLAIWMINRIPAVTTLQRF